MLTSCCHSTKLFLNYNFNKEQCMLPEDDCVIETCRSILSFFNVNFRFLK